MYFSLLELDAFDRCSEIGAIDETRTRCYVDLQSITGEERSE